MPPDGERGGAVEVELSGKPFFGTTNQEAFESLHELLRQWEKEAAAHAPQSAAELP